MLLRSTKKIPNGQFQQLDPMKYTIHQQPRIAAKNMIINTTQGWIRLAVMPLNILYRTDLLQQKLRCLQKRSYTVTLFSKVKLINRHECDHIYTKDKEFIWIMPLFIKVEVDITIRAFSKQVGIPNELHLDRDTYQMSCKSNFQCTFQ